jgi:hypothetical protein
VSGQEAVLKCPFAEVRTTTRTWATGATDRIKAVADLLTQRRKRVPGDENLEVTYDEVRSLVPPPSTEG